MIFKWKLRVQNPTINKVLQTLSKTILGYCSKDELRHVDVCKQIKNTEFLCSLGWVV